MTINFSSVKLDEYIYGDGVGVRRNARLATHNDSSWSAASLSFINPDLSITGLAEGLSRGLIDGVEPVDGNRILIKDAQHATGAAASAGFNGIWLITGGTSNTLTAVRDVDFDIGEKSTLVSLWILDGDANISSSWVCTSDTVVASNGSNALHWTRYDVAGVLSAERGGTGTSALGGVNTLLYTSAVNVIEPVASANNAVLKSSASGVPVFSSSLPSGLSIPNLTALSISDALEPLQSISLVSSSSVALTADRNLVFDVKNANRKVSLGGDLNIGGNLTTSENALSFLTTGSTTLTLPESGKLASEDYVDAMIQGLHIKSSVRMATIPSGNWSSAATLDFADGELAITGLTTGASRGLIDGIEPVNNTRILIKDAASAFAGSAASSVYNGLWCVSGGSSTSLMLVRAPDANIDSEVMSGLFVFVEEGTNADNGFVLTTNGAITLDSTPLEFAQFSGAGQIISGNGITKSGNTISVLLKANGGLSFESSELAVDLSASSISGNLAVVDGGTGLTSVATNGVLFGNNTSALGIASSVNNSVLTASAAGVPEFSTSLPATVTSNIATVGTLTSGTWNAGTVAVPYGGTGKSNVTLNALVYGQGAAALAEVVPSANSVLISGVGNVPSWNTTLPSGLSLPTPKITGSVNDLNNNELFKLTSVSSAVNELTFANAATGFAPVLSATGGDANVSLAFQAKGTGSFNFQGSSTNAGEVRLYEVSGNGSNFIGHKAPASLASDTTYTWASAPVANGYVLTTSTSGALSWVSPSAIGAKRDLVFTNGNWTATKVATTVIAYLPWINSDFGSYASRKLVFYHSTATRLLTVEVFDGTNVLGSLTTSANTSGVSSFAFDAPDADVLLQLRIIRNNGAGSPTNPRLLGSHFTLE